MPEELLANMASPGPWAVLGSCMSFWEWPGLPETLPMSPLKAIGASSLGQGVPSPFSKALWCPDEWLTQNMHRNVLGSYWGQRQPIPRPTLT